FPDRVALRRWPDHHPHPPQPRRWSARVRARSRAVRRCDVVGQKPKSCLGFFGFGWTRVLLRLVAGGSAGEGGAEARALGGGGCSMGFTASASGVGSCMRAVGSRTGSGGGSATLATLSARWSLKPNSKTAN